MRTKTSNGNNGHIEIGSIDPRDAINSALGDIKQQLMPAFDHAVRVTASRMLAQALTMAAQTIVQQLAGVESEGPEAAPVKRAYKRKPRETAANARKGRPESTDGSSLTEKIVAALVKAQKKAHGPVHHSMVKAKGVDSDQVQRNLQNMATSKRHGVVRKGEGRFAIDTRELQ